MRRRPSTALPAATLACTPATWVNGGFAVMSPAAQTRGLLVRSRASVTTNPRSSTSTPAPAAAAAPARAAAKPSAPWNEQEYRLGPGDKLRVEVYREAQLSQSLQVRPDGRITLPLIGDVAATGKTPEELREAIATSLKAYITNPVVTVIVQEAIAAQVYVIGEVFTPGGNWSSYPPHKHDRDAPPGEVDLEETYYYRFREPEAFGVQRLYGPRDNPDVTVTVRSGELVLVRDGYHPFVAAHGFDAYYLNVLAGTRRSMAASDDPRYAAFRARWPEPDPRVPVVPPPYATESKKIEG